MARPRMLALLAAFALTTSAAFCAAASVDPWPGDTAAPEVISAERIENSLGMAAKLLASAVFLSGREPEDVITRDLQTPLYIESPWSRVTTEVDRAARRITLRIPGVAPRTAVFTGEHAQGVVLLPVGETELRFEPRAIPPRITGDILPGIARPAGIDEPALARAVASAFSGAGSEAQQTRALVIVFRGAVVAEAAAPGFSTDQPLIGWSMGKTLLAALLGVSVAEGPPLDLHAPAPIDLWRGAGDPRAAITPARLLQMSGGLDSPSPRHGDADYATTRSVHSHVYYGIRDAHAFMLARPLQHPPGTVWAYRNNNTFGLGRILRDRIEATGGDYHAFPQRRLLDHIGARTFTLETDLAGNFLLTGYDYGSARDWARFGELLRRDGVGPDGARLLPEGWVDFLRTPAPAAPRGIYGGQVWLNTAGAYPSVPRDAFYARGWMEQITLVVPSRELVVVRLGHSPGLDPPKLFNPWFDRVLAAVLAALPAAEATP